MEATDPSFVGVSDDSLVVTPSGVEEIGTIRPGREVLTDDNRFEKVTAVQSTKEVKQSVYKLTIPLLDDILDSELYVGPGALFYGLPRKSDLATEIAVSKLSDSSFVFIPNRVKRAKPVLSYHLKSSEAVSDNSGVFVAVGRVRKVTRKMRLVALETESGSFVANGIGVRTQ